MSRSANTAPARLRPSITGSPRISWRASFPGFRSEARAAKSQMSVRNPRPNPLAEAGVWEAVTFASPSGMGGI